MSWDGVIFIRRYCSALIVGLIALAGHIALLLWGTRMVQTGIQRAFGPNPRSFLDGRSITG